MSDWFLKNLNIQKYFFYINPKGVGSLVNKNPSVYHNIITKKGVNLKNGKKQFSMGNSCNCDSRKESETDQLTTHKIEALPEAIDSLKNLKAKNPKFIDSNSKYPSHSYHLNPQDDSFDYLSTNPLVLNTLNEEKKVKLPPIEINANGIIGVYEGEWSKGRRDGQGEFRWNDGTYYSGSWRNDKTNGLGKLVHANGDIYEGKWENDMANGYGEYTQKSGAKYFGEWQNDMQNGKGREIWPDGAIHEGIYKDGKKNGQGKIVFSDNSSYEGEFKDNNIHGYGVYIWNYGKQYKGDWVNGI